MTRYLTTVEWVSANGTRRGATFIGGTLQHRMLAAIRYIGDASGDEYTVKVGEQTRPNNLERIVELLPALTLEYDCDLDDEASHREIMNDLAGPSGQF